MKNINKQWHKAHRMPKNPTHQQRIKWHTEHVKHCSCRPMPEKFLYKKQPILVCCLSKIFYLTHSLNVDASVRGWNTLIESLARVHQKLQKLFKG